MKVESAGTGVFIVNAKQEWQATGITINSGESFTITGKGTYADGSGGTGGNVNAWASPDGRSNQDFSAATGLLAPNFPFAALIGKIGSNGVPFGIGSYLFKTAETSGDLYLSINDKAGTFGDNFGYAVVIISVNTVTTDINQDGELVSNPSEFKLEQNYPNPFNPTTTIKYQIPELGLVTLKVYDILGREVKELVNAEKPVGTYEVVFNAKSLPSGIYVYELQAGDYIETKKLVLLK